MQKLALNVKIEQIEQVNGYVKIGSTVKKSDQIFSCEGRANNIRKCI